MNSKLLITIGAMAAIAAGTSLVTTSSQAAHASGSANPLRVSLIGRSGSLVDVTITNTSGKTVRLPKWQLPSAAASSNLFQVQLDGKPLRFRGAMEKRGVPTAKDFAVLRAGQSIRTSVDLGTNYEMTQVGNYTVTFSSPLEYASFSGGASLKQGNGALMFAQSAPILLWVDGNSAAKSAKHHESRLSTAVAHKQSLAAHKLSSTTGVVYSNCSTTQQSSLDKAVAAARNYSEKAKGYLNAGKTGAHYTTWFGSYTSSRYSTAKQHFVDIDDALDQRGGEVEIDCNCTKSIYARVWSDEPYRIEVCKSFWTASTTGTDSKGGTLVHEMSHFDIVAATDDVVYGQSGAKSLAINNPASTLNNADSHEYFAENTPSPN